MRNRIHIKGRSLSPQLYALYHDEEGTGISTLVRSSTVTPRLLLLFVLALLLLELSSDSLYLTTTSIYYYSKVSLQHFAGIAMAHPDIVMAHPGQRNAKEAALYKAFHKQNVSVL